MVTTYLLIPDIHVPFADKLYLKLIKKIIKIVKPNGGTIQMGDGLDCFQISSYPRDPERKNTVFDDIIDYRLIIDEWQDLSGQNHRQLEGNHCQRLQRYIWTKAPEISRLVKSMPDLLNPNKLKSRIWYELSDWKACRISDAILHHGVFYSKHCAMGNLERYPTKLVTGHVHRFQYVSNGERWSAVLGHGSDEKLTAHNATPTLWQQAFGLLHDVNGICSIEIILVNNGSCVLWGKPVSC